MLVQLSHQNGVGSVRDVRVQIRQRIGNDFVYSRLCSRRVAVSQIPLSETLTISLILRVDVGMQ